MGLGSFGGIGGAGLGGSVNGGRGTPTLGGGTTGSGAQGYSYTPVGQAPTSAMAAAANPKILSSSAPATSYATSAPPGGMATAAQTNPALPNVQAAANTVLGEEEGSATSTPAPESSLINDFNANLGPKATQGMIDTATGNIRANAAGATTAADEAAAARGGYGGGADSAIASAAAMAQGQATAGLTAQGQQLTDTMILGGEPIMSTPTSQNLTAEGLAGSTVASSELPTAEAGFTEPLSAEEEELSQYLGSGNLNLEAEGMANNANLGYAGLLLNGMNSMDALAA